MRTILDIVTTLYEKTIDRKLNWQVGSENSIWLEVGNNLIEIEKHASPKFNYVIKIKNLEGAILDERCFYKLSWEVQKIETIFQIFRQNPAKVDQTIAVILAHLEKI